MFSIKVKREDGYEFVKSDVKTVMFSPPIAETQKDASLFVWYKDEPSETITEGQVFVMNENGKTVADYRIYGFPKVTMATDQKSSKDKK